MAVPSVFRSPIYVFFSFFLIILLVLFTSLLLYNALSPFYRYLIWWKVTRHLTDFINRFTFLVTIHITFIRQRHLQVIFDLIPASNFFHHLSLSVDVKVEVTVFPGACFVDVCRGYFTLPL